MRYLHTYNEGFLDKIKIKILFQNGIKNLCLTYDIKNYTINSDGSIDVDGDVDISPLRIRAQHLPNQELKKLPLKFGEVTGNFDCSYNQLTTLEGAPRSVWGDFNCSDNKLTTLEGAPESVGGNFLCYWNLLCHISELFPDSKTFYKLSKEWQFFAGGNKIYKHKFLEAMLDIDEELPENIPGYEYI